MSIFLNLIINVIDYLIIFRYFNFFSEKEMLKGNIVLVFFLAVSY